MGLAWLNKQCLPTHLFRLLLLDHACHRHRGSLVVGQCVLLVDMTRVVHCMGLHAQSHSLHLPFVGDVLQSSGG